MHTEYERISKYIVPPSSRKLTLILIVLSAFVTLLTIWFLPILDHLFAPTTSRIKVTPVELVPFVKPKKVKIYQEPQQRSALKETPKFSEMVPQAAKQVAPLSGWEHIKD